MIRKSLTPKKEIRNVWFICQKCKHNIPSLSPYYSPINKTWEIEIRCSCDNKSYSMTLGELLKNKSIPIDIKEILFSQYQDKDSENTGKTYYCKKCDLYLSDNLVEEHKKHNLINLKDEANKVDQLIEKINSDFYVVKQNIEINNNMAHLLQIEAIDEEIGKLTKMKEKIELAYKQNMEINTLMIEYVKTLISNYESSRDLDKNLVNFNVLENLINNTEFNMNKFVICDNNILENSEKLCKFYNNNIIIRRKINKLDISQKLTFKQNINSICQISDGTIAFGEGGCNNEKQHYDILIYELDKNNGEYKLLKNIEKAHNGEITSLDTISINNNKYLLSGDAYDKCINIYDINSDYKKILYLSSHNHKIQGIIPLNKMKDYKNWIASCSTGTSIKLWDLSDIQSFITNSNDPVKGPDISYTIKAHMKTIKCLYQMNDGILISNSSDKKLKFWDMDQKICIKEMNDIVLSSFNSICELDNNRIIVGCFDVIKIININNLVVENELMEHETCISCLNMNETGLLFSGDFDGNVFVFEVTGDCRKILSEKRDSAIKLIKIFNDDKIILGMQNYCLDIINYK